MMLPKNLDLLQNIQANIIKPHNRNHVCLIFVQWKAGLPEQHYLDWLNDMSNCVTSHQRQLDDTELYKNTGQQFAVISLALTKHAYTLLPEVPSSKDVLCDDEFSEGMQHSESRYLPGKGAADKTDPLFELSNKNHHACIIIAHDKKKSLVKIKEHLIRVSSFQKILSRLWIIKSTVKRKKEVYSNNGKKVAIGPFGFEDGIATPKKEKDLFQVAFGKSAVELVNTKHPGTYLALQKIDLNTKAFKKVTKRLSEKIIAQKGKPDNIEYAEALLMGRFKNGTPLAQQAIPVASSIRVEANDFDYSSVDSNVRCPVHAHIRLANPRANKEQFAPIVRRGFTYYNGEDDGDWDESLLFMSYQTSIEEVLLPMYDRMHNPTFNKEKNVHGPLDAITYPLGRGKENWYHSNYGKRGKPSIKFPKSGQYFTRFITGAFYYCPSLSFLRKPS